MTLTPAYGRDYKSKAAILADLLAGKDFTIADYFNPHDGKPCNLEDLRKAGVLSVNVRYGNLRKLAVFSVEILTTRK